MFMGDINILVDIGNSREILVTFLTIIHSQSDWVVDTNAFVDNTHWKEYPNGTARYFCIDLEHRRFGWSTHDKDATARGRFQVVATVEEASSIAHFAIANSDVFICDPEIPFVPVHDDDTPDPVIIQNDNDELPYFDIEKIKKIINGDHMISFKKSSYKDITSVDYKSKPSFKHYKSYKEKTVPSEYVSSNPCSEVYSSYQSELYKSLSECLKELSQKTLGENNFDE